MSFECAHPFYSPDEHLQKFISSNPIGKDVYLNMYLGRFGRVGVFGQFTSSVILTILICTDLYIASNRRPSHSDLGFTLSSSVSVSPPLNWISRLGLIAESCLRDSDSPYGSYTVEIQSREDRDFEYHRLLDFTTKLRRYPKYTWAGYRGPWDEEMWVAKMCCSEPIDEFGPYVPLFVLWVNCWKAAHSMLRYRTLVKPVFEALKREFLYITLSSNDFGLEGSPALLNVIPPNLLVVSCSGKGHVPILFHLKPQPWVDGLPKVNSVVFLGQLNFERRRNVVDVWKNALGMKLTIGRGRNWTTWMQMFDYVLSPRGNARGCFRTSEVLEMGLLPILAFREKRWVPYLNSSLPWNDIGAHAINREVEDLVPSLVNVQEGRVRFMRATVRRYKHTHFTIESEIEQMHMFMKSGFVNSDLRCDKYYETH